MTRSLLALSLLAGAAAAAPPARDGAPDVSRIDAVLAEQMENEHIPGLAFVAVRDDRVVLARTLGLRDVQARLPVTPDTLFPIGSCTKAFTSMAIGLSQDRGLLSLDDSPHRFLPYFRMADPEADTLVTIRDMLSHRTGLKAYADLAAEPGVLSREEYLRVAIGAAPVARLRARFQYSNAMYTAAGEILARIHGVPWETVIERTLFQPLGMARSVPTLERMSGDGDRAVGNAWRAATKDWESVKPPASLAVLGPAGSIASSANDMTRWVSMLANGGVLDGNRLVSEEAFRALTRPHMPVSDAWSYALGWAVYTWNGHTVVEHNGGSRGISALVSFMPERRAGFVFLANTSPNFMTRIGNAGKLLWPALLGEQAPDEAPPAPAPSPSPSGSTVSPARLEDVLARAIAAQGGAVNMGRHTSMEVRGRRSYDNQGVEASQRILAEAPARRSEEETWTAAGKPIGRFRLFFDGERGGQETTFDQDSTNEAEENEAARRDFALHPLLELERLYREVKVRGKGDVKGEETDVLELQPATGPAVLIHVSSRTGLVLQRVTPRETWTFGDYRNVDGEFVPFRITVDEPLGTITSTVDEVRYNVGLPKDAFAPRR
jgi:CubicO group peptidase (beta-lactamase class C family)